MLAVISHPDCLLHDAGPHHPECADRLHAINNQIISSGLDFVVRHYDAPLATKQQLGLVHDPAYVESIFQRSPSEGYVELDGDTIMSPGTLNAALRAAGAGVMGVDLVVEGKAENAFCPVRPPGHHAERARARGFCLFDNIAVAAAHALSAHGLERVAIVDFDVHHGNGTEDIFRDESRVLFCSSFQHPFYPFSGTTTGRPNYIPVPLPHGARAHDFRNAIEREWLPALDAFRPEFVFVSAGFDAHALDDMSGLNLTEADYAWVTTQIKAVAERHAGGRIVSMLEGGYETGSLARSAVAHMKVLAG
ncbi:MAG: histone deacetylase family protein [Beijerinckiaceae bacterium]